MLFYAALSLIQTYSIDYQFLIDSLLSGKIKFRFP